MGRGTPFPPGPGSRVPAMRVLRSFCVAVRPLAAAGAVLQAVVYHAIVQLIIFQHGMLLLSL